MGGKLQDGERLCGTTIGQISDRQKPESWARSKCKRIASDDAPARLAQSLNTNWALCRALEWHFFVWLGRSSA